jgi:hypothetical protein
VRYTRITRSCPPAASSSPCGSNAIASVPPVLPARLATGSPPPVNSAIAFGTLGGVQAITRTGAVVHASVGAITTVIDHGAHAGVPVYPDRPAIALDDGGIVIETLGPHTLDQLTALLARATTYRLPAR